MAQSRRYGSPLHGLTLDAWAAVFTCAVCPLSCCCYDAAEVCGFPGCLSCTDLVHAQLDKLNLHLSFPAIAKACWLPLSIALNLFSAISNVLDLPPRNSSESYNLARYIVFYAELYVLCAILGSCLMLCMMLVLGPSPSRARRVPAARSPAGPTGERRPVRPQTIMLASWTLVSYGLTAASSISVLAFAPSAEQLLALPSSLATVGQASTYNTSLSLSLSL